MKYLLIILAVILLLAPAAVSEELQYDDEGNIITSVETKAMFFFPDIGVGAAFNVKTLKIVNTLNVEILDTDDSPNIIPLKIKSMPKLLDIIGDVGIGDGLVMMGLGVRFLPILEPGVLAFVAYDFNNGCITYGPAIRFGIKF